jgi:hypothetical protein
MKKNLNIKLKPIPKSKPFGKLLFDRPHCLHSHEIETIDLLRRFGDDVTHITPSQKPGTRTPDIKWRGERWEIKSVSGNSRANIVHALQSAKSQSPNIVICISKTKRGPDSILRDVGHYFYGSKSVKQVLVIIKDRYCIFS